MSYPSNLQSLQRQRGAALVVALLVFALSAALVVAMKSEFNRYFRRVANTLLAEQGQAYLRGAEDLAAVILIADYDLDKENKLIRDDLNEQWASPAPPFLLDDGGWMKGELEDLQGRFNLNHLKAQISGNGTGARKYTAPQEQFIRLLQSLEEPPISQYEAIAITDAIGDWLDTDDRVSPEGAEDDYYYGKTPPHRAANRPMASPSELRSVANITPEIYRALAPLITVWPEEPEPLNINTAKPMLLRSINFREELTPISIVDAESLFEHRQEFGFATIKDLREHAVFAGGTGKTVDVKQLLDIKSSYFLLRAEVEVADRNMRLYSVLHRGNRRIDVIARANGSL